MLQNEQPLLFQRGDAAASPIQNEFSGSVLSTYLRQAAEKKSILEKTLKELDVHLANFLCCLKKQDGSDYEPSYIYSITTSPDLYVNKNKVFYRST